MNLIRKILSIFDKKILITVLDLEWNVMFNNIKLPKVPNQGDFVYINNAYYEVIKIIFTINNNKEVFIVINPIEKKDEIN